MALNLHQSIKKKIMLKQFFILCSGADKNILENSSEGEQTKYVGIGATVFFTAVMAFIASAYALFTVFDSVYPALLFGLVWSLLIFNLDRFIVSTIRKRDKFGSEFLQATPRIILAVIIAIVISKPLEIKIFAKAGGEKLFGSITNIDIAEALEKAGQSIERKFITSGIVKRTGKYAASISLHRDVVVELAYEIVAEKA